MSGTEDGTGVEGNTKPLLHKKYRGYFLTINNWEDDDWEQLENLDYRYLIYQFEFVTVNHIHACVYFKNPISFKRVKKLFPSAHIEVVKNWRKCIQYCSKEESRVDGPFEYGKKPSQGNRSDLDKIAQKIIDGTSANDIAIEEPGTFVKYSRGLQLLENAVKPDRTEKPTVNWLWGKSGTGKTRTAFESSNSTYMKDGTMWWDGYKQQEVIIIDDFDGNWPFRDLLRLLDRYPYQGQVKGGYVKINSPMIYITCEFPPHHFWKGNELNQVARRLNEVKMLTPQAR